MFETVQIAKQHIARLENPEAAATLDGAAWPLWVGGVTTAVRSWFGGDDEEPSSEEGDREVTPIAPWFFYYYF